MSALLVTPELMAQAATDLSAIGSSVNAAHLVAAAPTLSVLPAAADEVSAGIAHLFSGYAKDYQKLAGKAATFQERFAQHLSASADSYVSAEAANMALLLKPLTAIPTPVAAATAVQSTLNDLMQLVTNTELLLGAAAVASIALLAVSGFLSWLVADLVVLYFAFAARDIIESFPLYSAVLNVLIDAINPLFTMFPVLGQLVSTVTQQIQSSVAAIFWPVTVLAEIFQGLAALSNPFGMATAAAGLSLTE